MNDTIQKKLEFTTLLRCGLFSGFLDARKFIQKNFLHRKSLVGNGFWNSL